MRILMIAAGVMSLSVLTPTVVHAKIINFHTVLAGENESVPKAVPASGTADVSLDTDTHVATYRVVYSGLSGPAQIVHLHGLKLPGMKAPEVLVMHQNPTSPVTGQLTVTDQQMKELEDGQWYANVHTAQYPNGEIRGWLKMIQ